MAQTTAIETTKTISWLYGTPAKATASTKAPKAMPPPRMRQSIGRRSTGFKVISSAPLIEISGMISPARNTVS